MFERRVWPRLMKACAAQQGGCGVVLEGALVFQEIMSYLKGSAEAVASPGGTLSLEQVIGEGGLQTGCTNLVCRGLAMLFPPYRGSYVGHQHIASGSSLCYKVCPACNHLISASECGNARCLRSYDISFPLSEVWHCDALSWP